MPYTPPVARAGVALGTNNPPLSCFPPYPKSQQRDNTISGHGSRTGKPSLLSSRAQPNTQHRSPAVSELHCLSVGFSTLDNLAFEINSSDSDDTQSIPLALRSACQSSASSCPSSMEVSPPSSMEVSPPSSMEASPPSSLPTSADEETTTRRGGLREKPDLAQLQAVTGSIEQHRLGLPDMQVSDKAEITTAPFGLPFTRVDLLNKEVISKPELSPSISLSSGVREKLQSRPYNGIGACPDFFRNKVDSQVRRAPESERNDSEDDEIWRKPAIIRKKSGEHVRSALRASSRRGRCSSMPRIPISPKAVHFQENKLEHIRFFLQGERPVAVRASSSSVDSPKNELNFPFNNDEPRSQSPPFTWEIHQKKIPPPCLERMLLPVRIERIYLSPDTKVLIGIVAVRNLAFCKTVVARFTLDHWKTTHEVVAKFDDHILKSEIKDGCDRFVFKIELDDQTHLAEKTMYLCVRYNVNVQEYWDNNNSINYQVNFSKRSKPHDGKPCMQPKNAYIPDALPRRKPPSTSASRSDSVPPSDDFVLLDWFSSSPQPSEMVGDSPVGLKKGPRTNSITAHAPSGWKDPVNQQMLGNRYELGTSLAVAVQASYGVAGDRRRARLGKHVTPVSERRPASQNEECERPRVTNFQSSVDAGIPVTNSEARRPIPDCPEPLASTVKKAPFRFSSYNELLDKYCFSRNEKLSSHATKGSSMSADGASDN